MRKIFVGAMVSMDGVMQAPGGPTEDPTKGFKFGGWEMPYFDQELAKSSTASSRRSSISSSAARPTRFAPGTGSTTTKIRPTAASRNCSTKSRSTGFRAQARSYELAGLGAPPRHLRRGLY